MEAFGRSAVLTFFVASDCNIGHVLIVVDIKPS
jgi:hypothetical protein